MELNYHGLKFHPTVIKTSIPPNPIHELEDVELQIKISSIAGIEDTPAV
jgi:hypothetical protein